MSAKTDAATQKMSLNQTLVSSFGKFIWDKAAKRIGRGPWRLERKVAGEETGGAGPNACPLLSALDAKIGYSLPTIKTLEGSGDLDEVLYP